MYRPRQPLGPPRVQLEAAWRRLPQEAVFSGLTAAWIHGLDLEPCDPIDVTIPKSKGITTRAGMVVRRSRLRTDEVVAREDFQITSVTRTLLDVSHRLALTDAVIVVDMALHAGLVNHTALQRSLATYSRTRGVKALRLVLGYAEPLTESPMETRLRMLLVLGGLPRPEAQVPLFDDSGRFLGRPDLYYSDARLAIEYDGVIHRDTLAEDNRRQNRLVAAGVRVLRFTAADIYNSRDSVVSLVRAHLA